LWHLEHLEAKSVLPRVASPEKPPVELVEEELLDELLLDELLLEEELLLDELLDELLEDDDPGPSQAASSMLNIPIISILRIIDIAPHMTSATSPYTID
jgi:hypothetical protein